MTSYPGMGDDEGLTGAGELLLGGVGLPEGDEGGGLLGLPPEGLQDNPRSYRIWIPPATCAHPSLNHSRFANAVHAVSLGACSHLVL